MYSNKVNRPALHRRVECDLEEISPAGANPIPAMNKEIGGASRPEQQAPPKEEGTKKK